MSHDDDTCPHLVVLGRLEAENARLKAEVERLTKAGDAMLVCFEADFNEQPYSYKIIKQVMANWLAAKEGKLHA